ncbi:hypothetical protein PYS58_21765 [Chryseobacterium indologenes]|uniref:hypothetical protein n=1 Tax=Chryseobacterium indologenes TaxID=253 RepID=UPI0023E864B1|nr:hypothetical protein [Chryseobacterium indologenes]MDM1553021.1 hypothetical protein [Chryseobacterium indologenes]WET49147.1 hypothetical protein PYS58_21765 [Chryseobacterium indologenes]
MKLVGSSFSKENFRVIEDTAINMNIIEGMLQGTNEVPIYVIRNLYDEKTCNEINNVFENLVTQTGGNRIEEFVKVFQVGATQFQKNTLEYFEECRLTRPNIDLILSSISNTDHKNDFILEKSMGEYFQQREINFGPSSFDGKECNQFTIRKWNNKEGLSLLAHEDLSQLSVANAEQYEIGEVQNVIAQNLCIENSAKARLLLWNIAPDLDSKKSLEVEKTGYPYALDLLEGFDYLTLDTNPGDVYFINANYIHAVSKEKENKRTSLGRFIGSVSSNRISYWT